MNASVAGSGFDSAIVRFAAIPVYGVMSKHCVSKQCTMTFCACTWYLKFYSGGCCARCDS